MSDDEPEVIFTHLSNQDSEDTTPFEVILAAHCGVALDPSDGGKVLVLHLDTREVVDGKGQSKAHYMVFADPSDALQLMASIGESILVGDTWEKMLAYGVEYQKGQQSE